MDRESFSFPRVTQKPWACLCPGTGTHSYTNHTTEPDNRATNYPGATWAPPGCGVNLIQIPETELERSGSWWKYRRIFYQQERGCKAQKQQVWGSVWAYWLFRIPSSQFSEHAFPQILTHLSWPPFHRIFEGVALNLLSSSVPPFGFIWLIFIFTFKKAPCPTWGFNSQDWSLWDQESYVLLTEPARRPCYCCWCCFKLYLLKELFISKVEHNSLRIVWLV